MIKIGSPSQERAEELYDLAAKVFGGYFRFLRTCHEGYFTGSSYDWSVSRVAEDDGRMIAHIGVWEYRMRVGKARLKAGGIGAVATHGDYRKRGIMAKLFRALFPAMRQAGYHFTVLFGIRDFYHRFGYIAAWPNTVHIAGVDALPQESPKLKLRKVLREQALCWDGPIMRMYDRDNATRTGTAERPIYTLTGGLTGDFECTALCDSAGRIRGYLATKKSGADLHVLEAGGFSPPCGADRLLAAIRLLARRAKCGKVRLIGFAYDHPLCRALRAGDCSVEMHHSRSGGAMAAAVSLSGCLRQMQAELTDRLRRSAMKNFTGPLGISGAGEAVVLDIVGGKVRVTSKQRKARNRIVAGPAVARLLIGSAEPAAVALQSGVRFSGRGAALAEALFPKQWPMHYALDHF